MLNAFLWGLLATSSLILGGIIATRISLGNRALGIIMAFGAGSLISAVSYEHGGKLAGIFTVLGFFVSVVVVILENVR
jgi:hypothetical protein